MSISYVTVLPGKEQYASLFATTGWNDEHHLDADRLYEAISHSWYTVSAYDDARLVGFGRAISDGVLHALIVDLIVAPEYQGMGIGGHILRELVRKCRSKGIRDIQLFCARGKVGFYEKQGFTARPLDAPGMELK
ncbi:MAG: GNAT family N-acetyltransferase [Chloroflexota bacterium]